jgi:TonB family protein
VALFAVALALNALVGYLAGVVIENRWDGRLPRSEALMEVSLLPGDAEAEEEEALEKEAPEERDFGELVRNDRIVDERAPDTEQISEFDNDVDHQTQRPLGRDRPAVPPSPRGDAQDGEPSPPVPPSDPRAPRDSDAEGERGEGVGAQAEPVETSEHGQLSATEGARAGAKPPGIRGSVDALRALYGTPGGLDKVEDVDEGEENLLDTRRHRFASFFNRVRDAVAEQWEPDVVHAARDPDGRVFGNRTRTTRLLIRLAPDGHVTKIVVDGSSGVPHLDEEAIRAVRAAQPFTNPPVALIDPKTDAIEFGFQFILTFDGKTRIHRYRN